MPELPLIHTTIDAGRNRHGFVDNWELSAGGAFGSGTGLGTSPIKRLILQALVWWSA